MTLKRSIYALGLTLFVTLFAAHPAAFAQSGGSNANNQADNQDAAVVIRFDPSLVSDSQFVQDMGSQMATTLRASGTDAVTQYVSDLAHDPESRAKLQELAAGGQAVTIDTQIHPNEKAAIEWINNRFKKMGLGNVQFNGQPNDSLPDPQEISPTQVKAKKWTRYLAGPGVALAATLLKMHSMAGTAAHPMDYVVMMIPTIGVGVTTVALEYQFAHPGLNNHFWSKVWKFGGPLVGRMTNILVNIGYGMTLYAAGVASSEIPEMLGLDPAKFAEPTVPGFLAHALHTVFPLLNLGQHPWVNAFVASAFGGVLFHLAMGQFQTDLSIENQTRGSISALTRYSEETSGVLVNNGARVGGWILPGAWSNYAMYGFFLLKTLPQVLKTNITYALQDREVHRLIAPETAPEKNVLESCALAIGSMGIINLPQMRK